MPGLEDLYREIILDHYRNPRNRGELPTPPARRVEGFNPLCGDEIVVYLDLEDGRVSDVRIGGQWTRPEWHGTAQVKDVLFRARKIERDVRIDSGSIVFDNYDVAIGCPRRRRLTSASRSSDRMLRAACRPAISIPHARAPRSAKANSRNGTSDVKI